MEIIQTSGLSLLSVVNDILDFSKIEADKLELETIDFDLRTIVDDTADMLALRAHEKGLDFVCRIDPTLDTLLRGDPGRLRQILLNLAGNAIKFTSRGEVVITVQGLSETDDRLTIRFDIRDTGIGIPKEKMELLFGNFQQLDSSTTREYGGTGLGLVISKRLVEMMGGQIGIVSNEGIGSNFWFTIVLKKQPIRVKQDITPLIKIQGIHILIVDEKATNRGVLLEQLLSWNIRCSEADSQISAIEQIKMACGLGDPFQIIIIDQHLLDENENSMVKVIRADPQMSLSILVAMTKTGSSGNIKRFKELGFSTYLTKPVKQSALFNCLLVAMGEAKLLKYKAKSPSITDSAISDVPLRDKRILVAEDNEVNQLVAQRTLAKMGLHSDIVGDGMQVIDAMEKTRYDLVFMDVHMPKMDGFEATRLIRSGSTKVPVRNIPIIAMTASALKGDREECLKAGMNDYITKPVTIEALTKVLDRWLSVKS
jgi:CheY-like chemotaxis protein